MRGAGGREELEVTGYCGCGACCGWEWGLWLGPAGYLGLGPGPRVALRQRRAPPRGSGRETALLDRYWRETALRGQPYDGTTASLTLPREARRGPLHPESLRRPGALLLRAALFPVALLGRRGTVAADTAHFPFGTQVHVPGYGWGVVEDRGGGVKGPRRLDLYFSSHRRALEWGRQSKKCVVLRPGARWPDGAPGPLRAPLLALDAALGALFR